MTVAIIGSGNVAAILGRLIQERNHIITHIASRNVHHAEPLAKYFNCTISDYKGVKNVTADIFIVAVPDHAIADCINQFDVQDKFLIHTAGSVSKEILRTASENYGVLYPVQSLKKEMQTIPAIPFLIDGNTDTNIQYLEKFACTLSNDVQRCNDNQRLKLHIAAVIVNNFANHLYELAEDFCNKEKVDFNILKPLILETTQRVLHTSPALLQTGPAHRKDLDTVDAHLKILSAYPALRNIYRLLTDSILRS